MSRRCGSLLGALVVGWLAASPAGAQKIALVQVASGLDSPLYVTHAGDGTNRLFIVEQPGAIRVLHGTELLITPFLDISHLVSCCGEQGLFSVAFHPDYETNGLFYVAYTDNAGDTVVERYEVSANPNVADPGSGFTLLTVDQPFPNHNGGQLQFGPDGYLYIGMGDGGGSNDPSNNGQSLTTLLGKLLRIDVDSGSPYGIPPDNPYVGIPGLDEIWANGLRNPWRFSFDRATGDLFIGDVGQNSLEEIDFQPVGSTGCENYGWRLMEGSSCFIPSTNCSPGPPSGCNPTGKLTLPILEYAHQNNPCDSVTGGYRYRGDDVPAIQGLYLFADFCRGVIWAAEEFVHEFIGPPIPLEGPPPPPGPPPVVEWFAEQLLDTNLGISSFGEDRDGELYVVDLGGKVFRVSPVVALSPASGAYPSHRPFDLEIRVHLPGATVAAVELARDGRPWQADFQTCGQEPGDGSGTQVLRCPGLGGRLPPGRHEISVAVTLVDGRRFDAGVTWRIEAGAER